MSNQQIRVNLMFDANTTAAKSNIQQLATLLQQIATPKTVTVNGGAIQQAAQAAQSLQMHLQNAMNVNTGKLDLTKLNFSLKQAGLSLNDLSVKLVASGTQGQQAFIKLANSIAQAGAPAAQLNATVTQFLKTMSSAMMWNVAYGALQTVTDSMRDAVNYAKDLNGALNDIAIVSNLTGKELDDFAVKAAKAAKALNTTTTEYAKAALIFYQQGLSGKEVEERANVVTKLAQVTGESAQQVSDQMTAVWNNFYDGTKSLEYYADAITALGAATASSSDEITQGLEKFAAIAETVGLSYEYATAALATVTAQTRQSADVVGTAFKTLFARIQDLELGETLDDGVTLGKYSEALAAVGVNILDANNQVKDMDDILDEVGKKWNSIGKAQQTALAQTVAGMRQYTQFIAIMDNYDEFKINVDIASGAEGTLTEQWKVWADSYEAAAKRVEQRKNELYEALLDDEFVIGITDAFAGLIGSIGKAAEAMGGLGPIILTVIGLFANRLIPIVSNAATHFVQNWRIMSGAAQEESLRTKEAMRQLTEEMISSNAVTESQARALELTNQLSVAKEKLSRISRFLTDAQKAEYEQRMNLYEAGTLELQQLIELEAQKKKEASSAKTSFGVSNRKAIDAANKKFLRDSANTEDREIESLRARIAEDPGNNRGGRITKWNKRIEELEAQKQNTAIQRQRIQESSTRGSQEKIIGTSSFFASEDFEGTKESKLGVQYEQSMLKSLFQNDMGMSEVGDISKDLNIDTSVQNLEKVIQKIQEVKTTGEGVDQFAIELDNSLRELTPEEVESLKVGFDKLSGSLSLTEQDTAEVAAVFEKLKKGGKPTESQINTIKTALSGMRGACDRASVDLEELEASMIDTFQKTGIGKDELLKLIDSLGLSAEATEQLKQKLAALEAESKDIAIAPQLTTGQVFSNVIASAGQLAGRLSMVVSSFQMFGQAFDESVPPAQRLTSVLMGLSMLLPMISGLWNTFAAITTVVNVATKNSISLKNKEALATALQIALTKTLGAEKAKETAARWANVAAMLAEFWWIGIIIAAIAALVAITVSLIAAKETDAEKSEKAAKKASELAEQYKRTKEAYEDLKNSLSDYENQLTALNKLKEGTDEWKESVENLNAQVMELIQKYPELAKYVTNDNGVLKFTDYDAVLDIYKDRVNAQYNASIDANLQAKKAKNRANRTDFIEHNGDFYTASDWFNQIGTSTATGGIVGTAVGAGVGSVPLAVIGAAGGLAYGTTQAIIDNANAANLMDDAITKISNAYQTDTSIFKDFEQTLANLGITNQALIDALVLNKDAIFRLVDAEKDAADQEEVIRQKKVDNLLNSQGFYSENYFGNVQKLVSNKYQEEIDNKKDEDKYNPDKWHSSGWSTWYSFGAAHKGTDTGEASAKEYAELMGYGNEFDVTDFQGDQIKFKYKKEGEDEFTESTVTYEEMARVLAENAVAQEEAVVQYATRITNTIAGLTQQGNEAAAALLQEGNLDYVILSEQQQEDLKNGVLTSVFPDSSEAEIQQIAKDFGYGTIEAMQDSFAEAAAQYDPVQAAANIARRTAQEINAIFQAGAETLNTTTDALEMYASALIDANPELEKNKKLAAQLAVQHFKTAKGLNNLQKTFKEYADVLQKADKSSIDYYEALGKLNQAIEETFGVKVSADFLENEENLKDLEKAANNDVQALARLKKAVNEDFILNLNINENAKNVLNQKITELSDLALNSPIGTSLVLDDSNAIAALNEALYTGEATIDQIESMFNNANLQMPEYKTKWVDGEVTKSHSETKVVGPLGIEYTTSSDTTTTAQKAIPYFGDSAPTTDSSGNVTSYGGGGSLKITTSGNAASNANVLKYQGDSDDGSGGGGDSKKKNLADEIERYHEIDKTLERLEKDYDRISKAKDRAFGKSRLSYLDQEIAKTKELADATKQKLAEAEENLAKDRAALEKYGVSTNEYGEITNYDEVVAAQVEAYNDNPEGQEDAYSTFKDELAQYEETLALISDLEADIQDKDYQAADLALEKVQYEVELNVRLADNDLKLIEFQLENLGETVDDVAKKFELMGKSANANFRKLEAAEKGIRDTLELSGFTAEEVERMIANPELIASMIEGKELTEDQVGALEEYVDQIIDGTGELQTMRDEISDNLVTAFEDMNKEFDDSTEKLDHLTSMISSFQNVIDLAGEKALGVSAELMQDMLKSQAAIANSQIEVAKARLEQNKAAQAALQAELEAATGEEAKKEIQEALDEINAQVMEDEENLMSALESGLQAAADLFAREMDDIIASFEDAFAGAYGTFEQMQAAYDRRKEMNALYLNDYQKIYELSKLNRDIMNSIDETDSIRAKERLRDIQEEINALQESNAEMTQYEVDELRARYDLRVAEIALEEAQNAKSQVHMTRDAEGNWGYTYTADENAVGSAQQNYEDKLYAYQQLLQQNTDEMVDRLVQIPQEYAEAVAKVYEDQTLTDEQRQLAIEDINEHYRGMYEHVVEQLKMTNADAAALYAEDWSEYSKMTGYKISADEDWVDSFSETIGSQVLGLTNLEAAQDRFEVETTTMLQALDGAYSNYQENVKETLGLAIDDVDKFLGLDGSEGGLKYYLDEAEKEAGEAADEAKRIGTENAEAFKTAAESAGKWLSDYSTKIDEWNTKTASVATAVHSVITEYSGLSSALEDVTKKYQTATVAAQAYVDTSGNSSGLGNTNLSGNTRLSMKATGNYTGIVRTTLSANNSKIVNGVYYTRVYVEGQEYWVNNTDLSKGKVLHGGPSGASIEVKNIPKYKYQSLDTGGYTGEWDSSGRVAMLHQKELVLNARDTENFLAAVDILRGITQSIDLQAASQSNILGAIAAASVTPTTQTLEQEVTIHAEFPNATQRTEIEAAFDSLLNRASQFANRKK